MHLRRLAAILASLRARRGLVTLPAHWNSAKFLRVKDHVQCTRPSLASQQFSVMQYNILAGHLARTEYFPYSEECDLDWTHRREVIVHEARLLDSDIICCQELTHYDSFFQGAFSDLGYASIFLKRPKRAGSEPPDANSGCGIFYKANKFELKNHHEIFYNDTHDRIALIAQLKCKFSKTDVLMATTHLYWNRRHSKLQLQELQELEEALARIWEPKENWPIVVCGDFNNDPASELYQYMHEEFLQAQGIRMRSAYAGYLSNQEPPFTTITHRRCHTIDYIFHSHHLRPRYLLMLPSLESIRSGVAPTDWHIRANERLKQLGEPLITDPKERLGIPNSCHGSDHLPLMAIFELCKPADTISPNAVRD